MQHGREVALTGAEGLVRTGGLGGPLAHRAPHRLQRAAELFPELRGHHVLLDPADCGVGRRAGGDDRPHGLAGRPLPLGDAPLLGQRRDEGEPSAAFRERPAVRRRDGQPLTAHVAHLHAHPGPVRVPAEPQLGVPAGDPAVGDGVGGQLGHDQLDGVVHRAAVGPAPGVRLLGGQAPGEPGTARGGGEAEGEDPLFGEEEDGSGRSLPPGGTRHASEDPVAAPRSPGPTPPRRGPVGGGGGRCRACRGRRSSL